MGHFFGSANELATTHWTDGKWKPGDLVSENGSDPFVKAKSASCASPDQWDKVLDPRSATSVGHIPAYPRPDNVGLGWGGYDKLAHWQASGRQVTKDMMEEEEASTDIEAALEFVNESDEPILTVPVQIRDDLLPRSQPPPTLYQLLNAGDERNSKASPKSTPQASSASGQD